MSTSSSSPCEPSQIASVPLSESGTPLPAPEAEPPIRTWDLVATVVLLVGAGLIAEFVSQTAPILGMVTDGCGDFPECNYGAIDSGIYIAQIVPWVLLVIAIVGSLLLILRRRTAFWVPLVAAALMIGSLFLGGAISTTGVPLG